MLDENSIIYHYCSVDTFVKIMTSNSLWLSHAQTTNDGNEDMIFKNILDSALNSFDDRTPEERKIAKSIVDAYKKKLDFPYICCFSRNKDLLGQWRAYANDGQGVAIGFELGKLPHRNLFGEANADEAYIYLDEVNYDADNEELIKKIIEASYIIYHKDNDMDKAIDSTVSGMNLLSIFTKSSHFSDEQEIRMVYKPCYRHLLSNLEGKEVGIKNPFEINFRSNGSDLKSYFVFPLQTDSIKEIILGPKCKIDFAQLTIFLSQYAPRARIEKNITRSKISYR